MARKFLKSTLVGLLTPLYGSYITFCFRTAKVEWVNREAMNDLDKQGQKLIIAFWHGRMAYIPFFSHRPEQTYVMVSRHGDGELIARAMQKFRLNAVRGSSNRPASDSKGFKDRGGAQALRDGLKILKGGDAVAVTPDGPRGPRFVAQQGAIALAQLSGAPVIPLTFSARRAKVIRSWDRFLLPTPFSKAVLIAGEPFTVERGLDEAGVEQARKMLEDRLNGITRDADARMDIAT